MITLRGTYAEAKIYTDELAESLCADIPKDVCPIMSY